MELTKRFKNPFFLPYSALESHIAILGKTGSGKTFTAKGIAERLMTEKRRVCVVDPTGAWWGIKSMRDGKSAGFPVVIFGGDHADFPIGSNHGAAIAEIVATSEICSILDTSSMTVSDRTRFFTDFAETLLRKNRERLHLIIDEAHNFAPQGKVPDPQAGKMLHAANSLLSMGRSRGLCIMLITQRPQKLHKDSLTQAETLIAMRLVAPHDRRAVEDWISEYSDKKTGAEVIQSLGSLKTGTGWVWYPEENFLKLVDFPMIETYDSSRAPSGAQSKVVLAAVDMAGIEARLESAAVEVFNDDPKRLRKRIIELESELKKKPVNNSDLLLAEERGYEKGYSEGIKFGKEKGLLSAIDILQSKVSTPLKETVKNVIATVTPAKAVHDKAINDMVKHAAKAMSSDLSAGERKILTVLAQSDAGAAPKGKISILSGYSLTSSTFQNILSTLRKKNYLEGYGDPLQITEAGRAALGDYKTLPAGAALRQYWVDKLEKCPGVLLKVILSAEGRAMTKEEISKSSSAFGEPYSSTSSTFQNGLSTLRTLGLITGYKDQISASEDLL